MVHCIVRDMLLYLTLSSAIWIFKMIEFIILRHIRLLIIRKSRLSKWNFSVPEFGFGGVYCNYNHFFILTHSLDLVMNHPMHIAVHDWASILSPSFHTRSILHCSNNESKCVRYLTWLDATALDLGGRGSSPIFISVFSVFAGILLAHTTY